MLTSDTEFSPNIDLFSYMNSLFLASVEFLTISQIPSVEINCLYSQIMMLYKEVNNKKFMQCSNASTFLNIFYSVINCKNFGTDERVINRSAQLFYEQKQ